MVWVIPVFAKLFSDFGGALPGPTQIVISSSEFMQTYWYVIVFATALLAKLGHEVTAATGRAAPRATTICAGLAPAG
jgi:type II secretory pathway component PulF